MTTVTGELWLSTIGSAGLWGNHKEIWYPLLADGSGVLMDKEIEGYPMALQVSPFPKQILVVPKPFKNALPSAASLGKRVYEVPHVK